MNPKPTKILAVVCIAICLLFTFACEKGGLPKVNLISSNAVSESFCYAQCKIESEGNSSITKKGVCYSETNKTPTLSDDRTESSSSLNDDYVCEVNGLKPNTLYYLRAYAINSSGTAYSPVQTFTTKKGWTKLNTGTIANFVSVQFLDANIGWAASGKTIASTTDAGITWHESSFGTGSDYVTDISFVDENNGYAVGTGGLILKTTDGGKTWIDLNFFNQVYFEAVHFTDINTGYAVGERYIFKTIDGGNNWSIKFNSSSGSDFVDVQFLNANQGYFLNKYGSVISTYDAFATYHVEYGFNMPYNNTAFYFTSSTDGYIVGKESNAGSGGMTTNSGKDWFDLSIGTVPILQDVRFYDKQNGFAVGGNGTILKTYNAGHNWLAMNSGITTFLHAISCPDETAAYAVGEGGTILKFE